MESFPHTDSSIRAMIPRTWSLFFQRFGRLLPIQRMAIPYVMRGYSLVVIAPTAAGKTEAVLAPLLELCLREGWSAPAILYVAPTRALVNDMHRRLAPLVELLGINVGRRTEDHREVTATRWPKVVMTTPESLDSLMCRYPERLTSVRAIVLDDVHLVDDTDRGDQLRGLVIRLRRLVASQGRPSIRCYLLSATVAVPERLARRFLEPPRLVLRDPRTRWIESMAWTPWTDAARAARTIVKWAWRRNLRKVLVFVNTKPMAEVLGAHLKRWVPEPHRVIVHHGRLPRRQRLEVEAVFRESRQALCVATTTLELGIDVGDIDGVVLAGAPSSTASFLQRLGRGNRRTGGIHALAMFRDEGERVLLKTFLRLTRRGRLEFRPHGLSYVAMTQQLLSYIVQKRRSGCSLKALQALALALGGPRDLTGWIRRRLDQGWITVQGGLYRPGPRLVEALERGWLHSLIGDAAEMLLTVVDHRGQLLAEITVDQCAVPGRAMLIGGRLYRVERIVGDRVIVAPEAGDEGPAAPYPTSPPMRWGYRLGLYLRRQLWPQLPWGAVPVFRDGSHWVVMHWFGHPHGIVWSHAVAVANGWRLERAGSIDAVLSGAVERPIWVPPRAAVRAALRTTASTLIGLYGTSRFFRYLTPTERRVHLWRSLHWPAFEAFLHHQSWVVLTD